MREGGMGFPPSFWRNEGGLGKRAGYNPALRYCVANFVSRPRRRVMVSIQ